MMLGILYNRCMISRLLILPTLCILLASCASKDKGQETREFNRVFRSNFDTVWRATQQALLNYPMNINNMDTGFLQTLYITGKHRYKAPHEQKKRLPSGYQYRINVHILKSNSDRRTKVTIQKEVRIQKDFFSDPLESNSDGYEEKSLIYRIGREIKIEKKLRRAHEKSKGSS